MTNQAKGRTREEVLSLFLLMSGCGCALTGATFTIADIVGLFVHIPNAPPAGMGGLLVCVGLLAIKEGSKR